MVACSDKEGRLQCSRRNRCSNRILPEYRESMLSARNLLLHVPIGVPFSIVPVASRYLFGSSCGQDTPSINAQCQHKSKDFGVVVSFAVELSSAVLAGSVTWCMLDSVVSTVGSFALRPSSEHLQQSK